jgi:hypothetical protein
MKVVTVSIIGILISASLGQAQGVDLTKVPHVDKQPFQCSVSTNGGAIGKGAGEKHKVTFNSSKLYHESDNQIIKVDTDQIHLFVSQSDMFFDLHFGSELNGKKNAGVGVMSSGLLTGHIVYFLTTPGGITHWAGNVNSGDVATESLRLDCYDSNLTKRRVEYFKVHPEAEESSY